MTTQATNKSRSKKQPRKTNVSPKGPTRTGAPLEEDKKGNDLLLVKLTLANDCHPLIIKGQGEVYNHGDYEFEMYRHEYEYFDTVLLEDELDLVEQSYKKAERKRKQIEKRMEDGTIGNRTAQVELQTCNGPAYFFSELERGIRPIRSLELVEELGPEVTPETVQEATMKTMKEDRDLTAQLVKMMLEDKKKEKGKE